MSPVPELVEPLEPIVYIIDDEAALRDSLKWLLESVGMRVQTYSRAQDFLAGYAPDQPGCLLLDIRMPEMSGLYLQRRLPDHGIDLPVIIITGHGDVPMAVAAMKYGALDFIEKPCNDQRLLDCVQTALARDQGRRRSRSHHREVSERFQTLTPREREVMERVAKGMPNQAIAEDLAITRKTVEVHRSRVMDKMSARSLSELIRTAIVLNIIKDHESEDYG
jgi:FixJ family two-component response regulator